MSASQNNLSLTINQQDTNGVNILNRLFGPVAASATVGEFINGILTTTGATALTLPTTNIVQFFFKNTHATAQINLNITGATGTGLIRVAPGAVVAIWAPATGASGALTAITGTSDVANATYEVFLGG